MLLSNVLHYWLPSYKNRIFFYFRSCNFYIVFQKTCDHVYDDKLN